MLGRSPSRPSRITAGFDFPDYSQDYELVALDHPGEYPIDRGRVVSNRGLDIAVQDYDEHFAEEHVEWSNALHSQIIARGSYLCGPLARWALAADRLSPLAREAAADVGLTRPSETRSGASSSDASSSCTRPTRRCGSSPTTRSRTLRRSTWSRGRASDMDAPRLRAGILYHRYELDASGTILDAKIVPPTSQNQRTIEEDLRGVVERSLDMPDDELAIRCEQTIRNYDPCISCATHFLKLDIERR